MCITHTHEHTYTHMNTHTLLSIEISSLITSYTRYHTLTVNTLLCSDDDKVECSGNTRRSSKDTPVDAISLDFLIKSVMSRMLANPGTNIRIAPEK
jgi:hypothetical protein